MSQIWLKTFLYLIWEGLRGSVIEYNTREREVSDSSLAGSNGFFMGVSLGKTFQCPSLFQVCWSYPSGNRYQCITWAETGLNTSLITVVSGGWSEWGSQTSCSRTCGTGVQYRQRFCNNPK